jgi:hypothetical protein
MLAPIEREPGEQLDQFALRTGLPDQRAAVGVQPHFGDAAVPAQLEMLPGRLFLECHAWGSVMRSARP